MMIEVGEAIEAPLQAEMSRDPGFAVPNQSLASVVIIEHCREILGKGIGRTF